MSDPYPVLMQLNAYISTHVCGPQTVGQDGGVSNAIRLTRHGLAHGGEVGSTYTPEQTQRLAAAGSALLAHGSPTTRRT